MAYLKSLGCLLHTKVLTLDYRTVQCIQLVYPHSMCYYVSARQCDQDPKSARRTRLSLSADAK